MCAPDWIGHCSRDGFLLLKHGLDPLLWMIDDASEHFAASGLAHIANCVLSISSALSIVEVCMIEDFSHLL